MDGTSVTGSRRQWNGEPLVLFVEGYSDLCFYAEMMEHLGKHQRCFIQNLGGKGNLEKQASLLLVPDKLDQMEAVGVILDADDSADQAFALAARSLNKAIGVEIQAPNTWVATARGKPKFGVFIAGESASGRGEIETLAWLSWARGAQNRSLQECVSRYVECAQKAGRRIHSMDKARVGSLLAIIHDEDPRLGPAARAKVFDLEADELSLLRGFLGQM